MARIWLAEDFRVEAQHAHGAAAEERVALREAGGELVRAEVEDADGHRAAFERLDRLHVRLEVRLLVRRLRGGVVEELRAVEADALRAVREDAGDLLRELDVGLDADAAAVGGDGGQVAVFGGDALLDRLAALAERLVAAARQRVGVEDHHAVRAVHDHHVAAGDLAAEPLHADDSRDAERARQDRRVAGAPARLGGEGQHLLAVEPGGLRGRQVARDDDDGRRQAAEVFAPPAEQVAQQALLDVLEVARPLEQVGIAGFLERLAVAPQDLRDGVFGGEQPVGDERDDLLAQLRVLEHVAVDLEDVGGLRPVAELLGAACRRARRSRGAIRPGPCRSARSRGGPRRA